MDDVSTPPTRKRMRANPEQLAILEDFFSKNPTPNSKQREQLSAKIGMPDRTVQIWCVPRSCTI